MRNAVDYVILLPLLPSHFPPFLHVVHTTNACLEPSTELHKRSHPFVRHLPLPHPHQAPVVGLDTRAERGTDLAG